MWCAIQEQELKVTTITLGTFIFLNLPCFFLYLVCDEREANFTRHIQAEIQIVHTLCVHSDRLYIQETGLMPPLFA